LRGLFGQLLVVEDLRVDPDDEHLIVE